MGLEMLTEAEVQAVLDAYPTLDGNGFRYGNGPYEYRELSAKSLAETLVPVVAIMRTVPKTRQVTCTTYGAKHYIEDIVGYFNNGSFAVACALAGFKLHVEPCSLNAGLCIHRSWIKYQYARRNRESACSFSERPRSRTPRFVTRVKRY